MSGSDLPPGVRESDIPGNRPEDAEWDRLFEEIVEAFDDPDRVRVRLSFGYLFRLSERINEINRANGWEVLRPEDWDDPRRIPTVLALIHSEVSEALEGFRKGDRENVAEELADVLIRVLDATGGLGIAIDEEVEAKLLRNAKRGYRHGGKVV